MNVPHKWADVIKAWADGGGTVQIKYPDEADDAWGDLDYPSFNSDVLQYRIKPEPTPCQEAGIAVGDYAVVYWGGLGKRLVQMDQDDGDDIPWFVLVDPSKEDVERQYNRRQCASLYRVHIIGPSFSKPV